MGTVMMQALGDNVSQNPVVAGATDPSNSMPTLELFRGKEYPAPGEDPTIIAKYIEGLWQQGEAPALARYKQATFNILYANGRQWLAWKKSTRNWEDLPLVSGDFRVTENYILTILNARVQRLVSAEVNWRVIPEDNSYVARDKTKIAVNFIKARWQELEMEHKCRAGHMESGMTGMVALKSFWNPNIGPLTPAKMGFQQVPMQNPDGSQGAQLQPANPSLPLPVQELPVDENGQPVQSEEQAYHFRPGNTDTAIRRVFNLRINPEAYGWTDAEGFRWMIDSDYTPISVARERWPQIAAKINVMAQGESAINYETIIQASATAQEIGRYVTTPYATGTHSTVDRQKLCVIREYWEGRSSIFPKGRLICVVGGQIAYDGEWPQGIMPYAVLFGGSAAMSPYGRPPVNDLRSPQDVINREATAIAKEMWSNGTGKFIAWNIPGIPDQINRSDDDVVLVPARGALQNRSISDVIKRIDPAIVSPDRWRLYEQAKTVLFDIGSYHEVSRGQIPPGLDSGIAIQMLLEQETAQLKDAVENYKRTLIQWARHQLAIARWGYGPDASRWLPVNRPDLGYQMFSVAGADLPDPETTGIDIEYFRPQSESAVRSEVFNLVDRKMLDPQKALKILDLGGGFEQAFESETRDYGKARTENDAFLSGQFMVAGGQFIFPTGEPFYMPGIDDDAIHIDVHKELLLDPTLPWQTKRMVLMHVMLTHVAEIQRQQQAAVQQQLAMAGHHPDIEAQINTDKRLASARGTDATK